MPTITKPTMRRADGAQRLRAELGALIRARREALDLTQRDLGEMLGVGATAISAVELGRTAPPPEWYLPLATALQIDPPKFGLLAIKYTNPWAYALITQKDPRPAIERLAAEFPTRRGQRMNRRAVDEGTSAGEGRTDPVE